MEVAMSRIIVFALLFFGATLSKAQDYPSPSGSGGGGFDPNPEHLTCISPEEHRKIQAILEEKKKELTAKGLLKAPSPLATPLFDWPLRQAAGRNLYANYGISNFIDHDPTYPNHVLDYMGGSRTYDTPAGYNHQGTDIFLWPFSWQMMDNKDAEIVAASDGVILHKSDGNYDRHCAFNDSSWNAVYLQHADGSVTWYGHMKKGTQTSKPVGAQIKRGEFLGNVGSSGSSTGPHLHFEVYDPSNTLIDPWVGPSNPSTTSSWWVTQKPYIDPQINALLTHNAPPNFGTCPEDETENKQDIFLPGSTIYFAAYYHDQTDALTTNFRIRRPDNSIYRSWTGTSNMPYYTSSYWYWYYNNVNGSLGDWKFEADYNGKTYSHTFTLSSSGVSTEKTSEAVTIYPPVYRSDGSVQFDYVLHVSGESVVKIFNALGCCVQSFSKSDVIGSNSLLIETSLLPAGAYFLSIEQNGSSCRQKFVVLR
jgi:murein DD-endopeptidase MepM/ murein hydrolase activator NlpD